jgi:16S rRNA processing protein RimM
VARIAKTQGRRGEVAAQILTDFPERLAQRRQVWLWDRESEPRPAGVERTWPHKNYLVFHFTGVNSITEAQKLVGREIQIPRGEATRREGTFFLDELVGCRVLDHTSGAELGRVRELVATGGTDLLAVESAEGKELLIPFAEEFCRRIAPEQELIEVALPEGLRALNR